MTEIEAFIKKNFQPVEDKPGFVWFNKRNFQIISVETLTKCLENAQSKDYITHLCLGLDENVAKKLQQAESEEV